MPTNNQLTARDDAVGTRRKLDVEERVILARATALAELRDRGGDTTQLAGELAAATARRGALIAILLKAREQVFTADDELGAGLLDSALPVLLLPVRLETRYEKSMLHVRIYPDDVHRDAHEPPLTRAEARAREVFFKALDNAADRGPWLAAWSELVARVGASRALHVATIEGPKRVGQRPGAWSRAMLARLLPDRFVAYVWTDGGAGPLRALAPAPVREPLALGPDPLASDTADVTPLGESARWLHDYDEALSAGMAVDVPLGQPDARVERVVVLGVRASVDSQAQAAELEALLAAHHTTGGLGLLAPGSATNALDSSRPRYTSRSDPEAVYEREFAYRLTGGARIRRDPLYVVPRPGGQRIDRATASFALAEAFGIDALALGYVQGADDNTIDSETAARELIRAAFAGGVARAVAPSVSQEAVAATFDQFVSETSALGPFGTLLVGSQPYGVLPVMLADRARMGAFPAGLYGLLDGLRAHVFADAVEHVPRIGGAAPGDPGATLVGLLRSEGVARHLQVRAALGPDLGDEVAAAIDGQADGLPGSATRW